MIDVNLSPYTGEQQAIDRRRRMAEALQQQATTPIEMPTTPGVRVSPYAGLAKILQSYFSVQQMNKADEEQKAYQNRSLEDMATLLADVSRQKTIPGEQLTPAVPAEITPAGSPIQENLDRKAVMAYNLNNTNQGMRLGNEGQNTFMPSSITAPQIIEARDLPSETTEDVIKTEAKPATYGEAKQVPFLSPEALSDPQYMKTDSGKKMLLQILLQQKAQEQAAALRAQEIQKRNPEEDLYRIENGKYVVIDKGKPKGSFGQPVTEVSSTGIPLTVVYDKDGNRRVLDTAGAFAPNQWNSMPVEGRAKIILDMHKFGNLSAEQIAQMRQKDVQLDQEMTRIGFDTGQKTRGAVGVPNQAPMPLLPGVNAPATNSVNSSTVNAQPVVAPGSQVAPVVNQALAPAVKKPYRPLNAPSPVATPVPVVAPTPVVTGEQPPAGLSPKAQQQWIVENSKKQIELTKDKPQAELSATTALTNLTRMKNVAEELSQHKGLNSIVGKWNQYSIFDTSDNAVNARALQGTLVKQSATAALQAMRDASKTGGAVGGVSEKEWPILEQQIAALDSAQTPKAYRTALENLKSQVDSSMTNIRKAYEIQHGKLEFTPPKYYRQDEIQPSEWKVIQ